MFNLLTKHPRENGHNGYFSHMKFILPAALRLFASSIMFFIHSLFPFIAVPRFLNIEMTIQYLICKHHDTL